MINVDTLHVQPTKRNLCIVFLGTISLIFGFIGYNRDTFSGTQLFLISCAFLLCAPIATIIATQLVEKRILIYTSLFSAVFCGIFLLFRPLSLYISFGSFFDSLRIISLPFYFLGLSMFCSSLLSTCFFLLKHLANFLPCSQWRIFNHPFILWLIIFLAWTPCYLAYFPGVISYDMYMQSPQALGLIPIDRHHPPLHTFVWKMCLYAEQSVGLNALILYSILQMLALSGAFAYCIRYMAKRKINNIILFLSTSYFALNPVIAIFSFIPIKDVLFTSFFIIFTLESFTFFDYNSLTENKTGNVIRYIIFGSLCCLSRNNMVYALAASTILTLFFIRKYKIKFTICSLTILLTFSLINGPVYTQLGVKEGNSREMLSIPLQQIAHVVTMHYSELSSYDLQRVSQFLPVEDIPQLYNPRIVDHVKAYFDTEEFNKNPIDFANIWWDLFKIYPADYILSFINLNLPLWYPGADTVDRYSQRQYIETQLGSVSGYKVERASFFPNLLEKYEKVASFEADFLIPELYSINTPIWVLLLALLLLICHKKKNLVAPLLPALLLWCTYLLGPVSNCRYILPFMASYPIYFALYFQHSNFDGSSSSTLAQS